MTQTTQQKIKRLVVALEDLQRGECIEAAAELRRLHEENQVLLESLKEMVEVNDSPCRTDHHGYCQEHHLDDVNNGGCRVANARAAIAKTKTD